MQIIEEAIKRLNTHGWIQGSYGSRREGYCMLGALSDSSAIAVLSDLGDAPFQAGRAVRAVLERNYNYHKLESFNDTPGRTKEEVVNVLRLAIEEVNSGRV
ncbi:hypothetical protein [Nocardia sp. NPDC057440]|uniref:DUF6197 family protein n=1 Tax=Nocardia sp. NPDC057440 TaxID=3346134 RepID=UPI00366BDDAC